MTLGKLSLGPEGQRWSKLRESRTCALYRELVTLWLINFSWDPGTDDVVSHQIPLVSVQMCPCRQTVPPSAPRTSLILACPCDFAHVGSYAPPCLFHDYIFSGHLNNNLPLSSLVPFPCETFLGRCEPMLPYPRWKPRTNQSNYSPKSNLIMILSHLNDEFLWVTCKCLSEGLFRGYAWHKRSYH